MPNTYLPPVIQIPSSLLITNITQSTPMVVSVQIGNTTTEANTYIVGIGIGTLLGNAVFIFGGKWLASRISNADHYINWVIGGIFFITAMIQLFKNLKKKGRLID